MKTPLCTSLRFSWMLGIGLCALNASSAQALQAPRPKIAFLAGFSSPITSHVLTDLNLEKGYKVFANQYPEFEKTFDVIKFDNQGDPQNVPAQIDKIVADKIQFIIGLSKTSQALVAAPLSDEKNFFVMTPMATNDKVTIGHPLVARTCFSDSQQGEALARFAMKELKARRVLVLTNVDQPYSVDLTKQFVSLTSKKLKISEFKYVSEDQRFAELKKEITAFKPDLVFLPDYVNTVSLIMKEIYKIDPKLAMLGGDGWGGREVLDPTIEPMKDLKAYYTTMWNQEVTTPANKAFVKAHEEVFPGERVSVGASTMYDLLTIFWQAYQKASNPKTPDSVKKQLLAQTFQATTGPIRYTHDSDLTPTRKVVIIRLNAGKHEFHKTL